MNFAQLGLFLVYSFSVLCIGSGIYAFIYKNSKSFMNRFILLGEVFLLGSIFLVAELLILSLIGLYKAPYLWSIVIFNFLLLLSYPVRKIFIDIFIKKTSFDLALVLFIVLAMFFIFRNQFFLCDVDSVNHYLGNQKIWLSNGTSIIGNNGTPITYFFPQFDAVPYSLGISIFAKETLFPSLVSLSWRLIVILLIFGYTAYRFNRYYGLAASMFVLFNDHFFYSGVNHWVLINGAVIAFLFAASYNFYESRRQNSQFRLLIALIFLSQLIANKYQMFYVTIFMLILGIAIQKEPFKKIKGLFINRNWKLAIFLSLFIAALWYIKNFLATGDPVFPIFAGRLHVFNWTIEQEHIFSKVFGGLNLAKFFKYISYQFVWPGINPAKFVGIISSLFPLVLILTIIRQEKLDRESILELSFWLGLSILSLMGISLVCHQDPRYYRYAIGIYSFATIFSLHYLFKYCFNIKNPLLIGGAILFFSFWGYKIMFSEGGEFLRPTFKENIDVLTNRIHTDYAIKKHYPAVPKILDILSKNNAKLNESAWNIDSFKNNIPQFFLPVRPVASLWFTTLVKWDSYGDETMISNDLRKAGINWILNLKGDSLAFLPIEDYAKDAIKYERAPLKTYYDYGWPPELSSIN